MHAASIALLQPKKQTAITKTPPLLQELQPLSSPTSLRRRNPYSDFEFQPASGRILIIVVTRLGCVQKQQMVRISFGDCDL
jgi:hypothetical protein